MRLKHRQYSHWMLDCEDELNAAQGYSFIHTTWISQASPWNPETPNTKFRTKCRTNSPEATIFAHMLYLELACIFHPQHLARLHPAGTRPL